MNYPTPEAAINAYSRKLKALGGAPPWEGIKVVQGRPEMACPGGCEAPGGLCVWCHGNGRLEADPGFFIIGASSDVPYGAKVVRHI